MQSFAERTFVSGPEYDIKLQPSLADGLRVEAIHVCSYNDNNSTQRYKLKRTLTCIRHIHCVHLIQVILYYTIHIIYIYTPICTLRHTVYEYTVYS